MKIADPPGEGRVRRPEGLAVAAILICLLALQATAAWRLGVTLDEPALLLSARLYWRGADRLYPRDVPPLPKIVGGWTPALIGMPVPDSLGRGPDPGDLWSRAMAMMGQLPAAENRKLFFRSRLPMLVFPLLTGLLTWWWARQLFGASIGVLLLALFCLEPTALSHGSLVKNDLAATFGYLLFWYRAWHFWSKPTRKNSVLLACATLVGAASKLSLLILPPIAVALVLARAWVAGGLRRRAVALSLLLVVLIPYFGMIALCQFEASRLSHSEYVALLINPEVPRPIVVAARLFREIPVPRPVWEGVVSLAETSGERVCVYLWGRYHAGGTPWYFLLALAVKIPVPLQFLIAGGLFVVTARAWRGRYAWADCCWLLPGFLYIGLASFSSLQYGARLVLPALPFGLFLCGALSQALWKGRWRAAPVFALACLAIGSLRMYPNGISYFNLWSGGPEQGLRYLTDSNLDWGQSLPELSKFLRETELSDLHVAYFGPSMIWSYIDERKVKVVPLPFTPELIESNPLIPEPGHYVISASLLTGHLYPPEYRDYLRAFRERNPVRIIGYCHYLYRISHAR